jgi:hypothetical protein
MTKAEFVESKQLDSNVLEILEDTLLNSYTDTCKEYVLRCIELNQEDKVEINTIQYFEINNTVYMRA